MLASAGSSCLHTPPDNPLCPLAQVITLHDAGTRGSALASAIMEHAGSLVALAGAYYVAKRYGRAARPLLAAACAPCCLHTHAGASHAADAAAAALPVCCCSLLLPPACPLPAATLMPLTRTASRCLCLS